MVFLAYMVHCKKINFAMLQKDFANDSLCRVELHREFFIRPWTQLNACPACEPFPALSHHLTPPSPPLNTNSNYIEKAFHFIKVTTRTYLPISGESLPNSHRVIEFLERSKAFFVPFQSRKNAG